MAAYPLRGPEFATFHDRLRENADLSKTNWFRVGGPAEFLFKPADTADLSEFLKLLPESVPVTVLGVGSNVIVRDGGIEGVVIKLGRGFTDMAVKQTNIEVGAAALDLNVALYACDHGIAGLEFLSGIPGTIGGAVRMNAGAYGNDTASTLVEAGIVERSGKIRRLKNTELGFTYRKSALPKGAIVTHATFKGASGETPEIRQRIQAITEAREATQPVRSRTGGSTFKNPDGHKAWELIEKAGCRGLMVGAAQVSEKHCNFLINTGGASAKDLENLGDLLIKTVQEKTGVTLQWEIERIGKTA